MNRKQTHTYAELEVSISAYEEIKTLLLEAGYDHVLMEDGTIDMNGIGLARSKTKFVGFKNKMEIEIPLKAADEDVATDKRKLRKGKAFPKKNELGMCPKEINAMSHDDLADILEKKGYECTRVEDQEVTDGLVGDFCGDSLSDLIQHGMEVDV